MEATIEYKDSPNESTAYAVTGNKKSTVQLVATPAGDLELSTSPNVSTGYLSIDGQKHKVSLVHNIEGELELPKNATSDSGYVKTQDGKKHKVRLTANISAGGGGATIKNQNKQITENGTYKADAGYTGLGTVEVNVPTGGTSSTIFGVTIENMLGTVDAEGTLSSANEPFEVNLAGVKKILPYGSLQNRFSYLPVKKLVANDLVYVTAGCLEGVCSQATVSDTMVLEEAHFDSLEEVTVVNVFSKAFSNCKNLKNITFAKLKKVVANFVFYYAFENIGNGGNSVPLSIEDVFPVLEEISGENVFGSFIHYGAYSQYPKPIVFPAVKKIKGAGGMYAGPTFGSFYNNNTNWHFPNATEITGYIWNINSSYVGEIHFAAANQAAIEACNGYANKWGFPGATIYFDL